MKFRDFGHLLRKWKSRQADLTQPLWRKSDAWQRHERALISPRGRFLYIPIDKAASTSIKHAIAEFERGESLPKGFDVHRMISHHRIDSFYVSWEATEQFDGYRFTVVRHPLMRMISCYRDKTQLDLHNNFKKYGVFSKGMDFRDFLEAVAEIKDEDADVHFQSQVVRIESPNEKGKLRVDFVAKLENLDEDWQKIMAKTGLPMLRRFNSTPSGVVYPEPDPSLEKIVQKRFARDYELFEYEPLWR